jgi:hypothetical protein
MTAVYPTFTDVEGAVVAWLRALDWSGVTLHDASTVAVPRVLFAYNTKAGGNQIVVTRVGGAPIPGEVPWDRPMLQCDCWSDETETAAALASFVANAIVAIADEPLGDSERGLGGEVLSVVRSYGPQSDTPRYIVSAVLTTQAVV